SRNHRKALPVTMIAPPPPAPPPPAPAAPSPPLSTGARTAIRITLIVAAAVLVLGTIGSLTAAAIILGSMRAVTDTRALSNTMRSLLIDTADVPVDIHITTEPRATEPRAVLWMVTSTGAERPTLSVANEPSGSRVNVTGRLSRYQAELRFILPPDLARGL